MGLHGSSTTPVILQDVKVPAENLLGEVGKAQDRVQRAQLRAVQAGRDAAAARRAIGEAAHTGTRSSSGSPLRRSAPSHKLGEMASRTRSKA
jgi:alkylation response protein AidB-like acyl-CoA dehydrogenase